MALPKGLGLKTDTPSRLFLKHPKTLEPLVDTGTGEPAWIDLYSSDSQVVRKVTLDVTNKRIAAGVQRGKTKVTAEQITGEAVDRLVAATAGWSLVDLDGAAIQDFPHTATNARDLYAEPSMTWITDQVSAFIEDRANF